MDQASHNGLVAGSSPAGPTNNSSTYASLSGVLSGSSNLSVPETPFGRVLRDALMFADMAAGDEMSYRHDAGFEIHSMDLCIAFAKALNVEPCSDAYYEAINGLARLPLPSPTVTAEGNRAMGNRWITQTILHSETTNGNCMQAAVASLFGLPLSEVPHFAANGDRAHLGLMNFAQSYGFDLTCETQAKCREGLYLACGPTERGTSHMVVYRDGKLWHDPHPSRAGLASVEFVYIVEPLDPAIHVAALVNAKRLAPLMAKASSGPWESDTSDTEDGRGPYKARQMLNAEGKCIFETSNSDVQCVTEEHSEDGCYAWDEQAEADLAYIEAMDAFARSLASLTSEPLPSPALTTEGA